MGYGTLGQFLALQGCQYHGLDIAQGRVDMMRYRLSCLGLENKSEVQAGSALAIPYPDQKFDYVYSIGCLHHTGDIPKAVSEIYRVLAPGGRAIIMLYNRASMRLWFTRLLGKNLDQSKALYDANGWRTAHY
jgi:ubiquinone/menaquinone biosynthesis C-methylase UbiE